MATANAYAPVSTSPSTGSSGDRPATPGQSSTATATALQPPSPTATDPTSRLLAPVSSPLVRRLVYLVLFGVVMLSSTVVLSAAASLIRASPGTTKLLRSAASTAAPSILSASSTHEQLNKSKASRQPLPTAVTSTPTTKPLLDKRQTLFELYCRGSLLHDIQVNHVFADSKHFVDMPIKATSDAADIPSLYKAYIEQIGPQWMLMDQSERILLLKVFLDQHFDAPGSDMTAIVPRDYQDATPPPAIAAITNPAFQEWAFQLHKLWQLLGRVALDGVTSSFLHATPVDDPELARTQNVLVVPGGRFRESYYWDSFWIVEGLLVSDMKLTARGVVNNLLEYVAEFGFVPNGGRIYYLTRSQPPLLSDMVKIIAEAGKPDAPHGSNAAKHVDLDYLRAVVPILEKEYAFWMQLGPSSHAVEIDAPAHYVHKQHGHSGHHHGHHGDHNKTTDDGDATTSDARSTKRFILNRYAAHANEPRPESYREDFHDATMAFDAVKLGLTSSEVAAKQSQLYNDIIAGAESGWDFTSRWFTDRKNMTTIDTTNVVPVDLNVMMHRFERNMAHFHTLLGDAHAAATYNHAALERADAIQTLLWSNKTHSWHDWVITEQTHSPVIASSNYSPLWADGLVDLTDDETVENIVESLRSSGLIQVGGIQATTLVTGQQWDGPNAWPPSQDMVIEGLMALKGSKQAQVLARELMRTWVKAGYVAWQKTGLMFEKYNATTIGGIGTGGEYIPQFGFGWTNGVILKYLAKHQDKLDGVDVDDSSNDGNSYGSN